jgi:hypothetical protein
MVENFLEAADELRPTYLQRRSAIGVQVEIDQFLADSFTCGIFKCAFYFAEQDVGKLMSRAL